jgi:hypothetical protein
VPKKPNGLAVNFITAFLRLERLSLSKKLNGKPGKIFRLFQQWRGKNFLHSDV